MSPRLRKLFDSLEISEAGSEDVQASIAEHPEEGSSNAVATDKATEQLGSDDILAENYPRASITDSPPPAYTPTMMFPAFDQPPPQGTILEELEYTSSQGLGISSARPSMPSSASARGISSMRTEHTRSLSPPGSIAGAIRRKPVASISPPANDSEKNPNQGQANGESSLSQVSSEKSSYNADQLASKKQLRKVSSNLYGKNDNSNHHGSAHSTLRSTQSTPFLRAVSDFDDGEDSHILEAAQKGLSNVITELLIRHADIEAVSKLTKRNALCEAARMGHYDAVNLLVRHGCTLDRLDADGNGAIHLAAFGGHDAIVELLLSKGVPVDVRGHKNRTSLHIASDTFHPQTVQLLLRYLPEVDARDSSQRTPLHKSAVRGDAQPCSLLVA